MLLHFSKACFRTDLLKPLLQKMPHLVPHSLGRELDMYLYVCTFKVYHKEVLPLSKITTTYMEVMPCLFQSALLIRKMIWTLSQRTTSLSGEKLQ